jgi:serine/threonine-protein kinase
MGARKLKKSEQLPASARYELLVRLAAGGMGAVYLGVRRAERSPIVAIKRAHPHLIEDPSFAKMFIAEAQLASAISHPNAIGVSDVESSEDELLLIMRYVEGGSLGDMLATAHDLGKRVPPSVALRVVVDAARGLHAAHSLVDRNGQPLGIVHRDVSPQNILVGVDGVAAIVDFGVAKAVLGDSTQTSTGILKGKLAYMAPEYVSKRVATPQTDVFALGVVCWEAIANRRLFKGEDDVASMQRVLSNEAAPLLSEACGFDLGVSAVIARALVKDASKRFLSAKDFADALEAKARQAELLASPAEVGLAVRGLLGTELDERRDLVDEALRARPRAEAATHAPTLKKTFAAPVAGASTAPSAFVAHATVIDGPPPSMTTPRASQPTPAQAPAVEDDARLFATVAMSPLGSAEAPPSLTQPRLRSSDSATTVPGQEPLGPRQVQTTARVVPTAPTVPQPGGFAQGLPPPTAALAGSSPQPQGAASAVRGPMALELRGLPASLAPSFRDEQNVAVPGMALPLGSNRAHGTSAPGPRSPFVLWGLVGGGVALVAVTAGLSMWTSASREPVGAADDGARSIPTAAQAPTVSPESAQPERTASGAAAAPAAVESTEASPNTTAPTTASSSPARVSPLPTPSTARAPTPSSAAGSSRPPSDRAPSTQGTTKPSPSASSWRPPTNPY